MQNKKFIAIFSLVLACLSLTVIQSDRGNALNLKFPSIKAHTKTSPFHSSKSQSYLTAQASNLTVSGWVKRKCLQGKPLQST